MDEPIFFIDPIKWGYRYDPIDPEALQQLKDLAAKYDIPVFTTIKSEAKKDKE